ncbi:MAG TPA: DUF882 domain-containing protein [Gammaproteobacteria bacterium]|jgi:uncharacterized protein YcbK (DUF882 family)|nr:DUF882 domain-containing protein [Gammaproteobacteria bacterium]
MTIGRRSFLIGSFGLAGLGRNGRALAAPATEAQVLSLYHLHTAEQLKVTYREHGQLVPEALSEIRHFLRDFRNEQTHDIDVALLDQLQQLHATLGGRGRFEVISGYRSPATNSALRKASSGVAEHSLHLSGRAIDVRLTSAATTSLRDAAIGLRRGGVGYYRDSNFVHLDTGSFRTW